MVGCDLLTFDSFSLRHIQYFNAWLLRALFRFRFHLGNHFLALSVSQLLCSGLCWRLLHLFNYQRIPLLRLAVEAFLCGRNGVLLLMLPNVSRHSKDLIVRVPRQLLNRRKIVLIVVRFITSSFIHTASLSGGKIVILSQLLLPLSLLHFLGTALSFLPGLLYLEEVLSLALFTLFLLLISFLQLLLFPLFSFNRHLGFSLFL